MISAQGKYVKNNAIMMSNNRILQGATTSSKLGVQFLGLGYYYNSTEKN